MHGCLKLARENGLFLVKIRKTWIYSSAVAFSLQCYSFKRSSKNYFQLFDIVVKLMPVISKWYFPKSCLSNMLFPALLVSYSRILLKVSLHKIENIGSPVLYVPNVQISENLYITQFEF